MTIDPAVVPGLLLLALELLVLAAIGFVVARVALRQTDDRMALAQGLLIGLALWGLTANFVMYLLPGMTGAAAAWVITLALAAWLARRAPSTLRLPRRTVAGFAVAALALFWIFLAGRQLLSIVDASLHLGLAASIRAGGFPPVFSWHPGVPAPPLWRGHADRAAGSTVRPGSFFHDGVVGCLHLDKLCSGRRDGHTATRRVDQPADPDTAATHYSRLDAFRLHCSAAGHPADSRSDWHAGGWVAHFTG
ncbi:MAG: hypothetical protein OXR64_09070 [Chloroflexota bacterium]|nr:hypothetical protein [Chloroflexota bacterium]MDE2919983.1 hypothetical protein [Chloroflexota bacterium]